MNSLHTLIVPRNAHMSVRSLQGPQLTILLTLILSESLPFIVHWWPSTVISGMQSMLLCPEDVPPQYFICWTTWLRSWKCSQTNCLMPGFFGIQWGTVRDKGVAMFLYLLLQLLNNWKNTYSRHLKFGMVIVVHVIYKSKQKVILFCCKVIDYLIERYHCNSFVPLAI